MLHASIDHGTATPLPQTPLPQRTGIVTGRRRRGLANWRSGAAAEEAVARHYIERGATIRHRRLRTPGGELDLVLQQGGETVFVEVKRCAPGADSPISDRQWRRLESAALHYMLRLQNETGVAPVCRFDVALAGPDGRFRIVENARSFEAV